MYKKNPISKFKNISEAVNKCRGDIYDTEIIYSGNHMPCYQHCKEDSDKLLRYMKVDQQSKKVDQQRKAHFVESVKVSFSGNFKFIKIPNL